MQRSALCRSRRELSNEYLLAKIGVDTAENELVEVWGKIQFIIHLPAYRRCCVAARNREVMRSRGKVRKSEKNAAARCARRLPETFTAPAASARFADCAATEKKRRERGIKNADDEEGKN